jgi:beta-glucosidase
MQVGERMLREQVFPAYKATVDAGADMMMTSYSALNDVPCTANEWLIKDVLRGEMGFDGVVISDSSAIREMINHGTVANFKDAAHAAMTATVDMDMQSVCYLKFLRELVEEGKVTEQQIDEACLRVLKLKEKLGLFETPVRYTAEEKADLILKPEYIATAKKCAERSAVLLKNDGVLPLSDTVRSIALIGPFADTEEILGNWICYGSKQYGKGVISTIKSGIEKRVPDCEIRHVPACTWALDDDTRSFEEAVKAAAEADAVVLCLGEHQMTSGEANSRADIRLPEAQMRLAKAVCEANKNTAVVLFCGRPLAITELNDIAPAILCMWQPGTAGGDAGAALLFGDAVPGGKLTMSWPRSVGQCPLYYNFTQTGRPVDEDKQKRRAFCANYIDEYTYPLYPFGYGLSYTSFSYSEPVLSADTLTQTRPLTVSVKVKNTGKYRASEVVQLYIRDLLASVTRPVKELKEYEKIELAPGEEKTVTFEINEEMLRFWRRDMTFGSEEGAFTAFVGGSSATDNAVNFTLTYDA